MGFSRDMKDRLYHTTTELLGDYSIELVGLDTWKQFYY